MDEFNTMDEFRRAVAAGRDMLAHQARLGKTRLELLRLEKDRRKVFERLGREAYQQLADGTIPRLPSFERPFQVLQELEERIRRLEEQIGGV